MTQNAKQMNIFLAEAGTSPIVVALFRLHILNQARDTQQFIVRSDINTGNTYMPHTNRMLAPTFFA